MCEIIKRIEGDKNISEINLEMDIEKPWGGYITYARNIECTSKLLIVKDDLSIQVHQNRDEIWHLVEGRAFVYRGEVMETDKQTIANLKITEMLPGDLIFIPKNMVHAVSSFKERPALIIETALGHSQEEDIKRIYDKHGRSGNNNFPEGLNIKEIIAWCQRKES